MGIHTSASPASEKPSVLVVDDETGPRDALKVILRPFFTIHSADNAKSALEVLKERHIDLITLDQKLPDRQGIDLLQDIKQDYADIEVIIITGYGSLKSAMEGIRYGAAGYLLKPFNVTESSAVGPLSGLLIPKVSMRYLSIRRLMPSMVAACVCT